MTRRNFPNPPPSKCGIISAVAGAVFLFKALLCVFFRAPIHGFVELLIAKEISLGRGTAMVGLWSDPPFVPDLQVYVYNVTNPEAFLQGLEKPRLKEVGPYTYAARQAKDVLGWSDDEDDVIRFRSRTLYTFSPEKSVGSDSDVLTVPNILLMSGMLKPEVRGQSGFIKRQVVWPVLTSAGLKQPFVQLEVGRFLWGYQDELACLETSGKEEDGFGDVGDFWEADEASDETTTEKPSFHTAKKNYRRPDGRCLFGALVEKNATWERPVAMMTGTTGLADKGRIVSVGGAASFDVWTPKSSCDSFAGSREPSALPPTKDVESFSMLLGIMCRTVTMEHTKNVSYSAGLDAKRFTMTPNLFDMEVKQNRCYRQDQNVDLPRGVMGVQGCCEGAPLAVSAPHFLHAENWYLEQVAGVTAADPELHELYMDLEPKYGAPVGVQMRFQLNMLLRPDPDFPPLAHLAHNLTVLPIFWAQEGYDQVPTSAQQKIELALKAPGLVADGLVVICLVVGLVLLTWPIVTCVKQTFAARRLHKYRRKQRTPSINPPQPSIKSAHAYNVLPFKEDPTYEP